MRLLTVLILWCGSLLTMKAQEQAWYLHERQYELDLTGKLPNRMAIQDASGSPAQVQNFQATYRVHCQPLKGELYRITFHLQQMQVQQLTRSISNRHYTFRSYNTAGVHDHYVPGFTQNKPNWAFQDTQVLVVNHWGHVVNGNPLLAHLVWLEEGSSPVILKDSLSLEPLLTSLEGWNQLKLFRELKMNTDSFYQVEYFDARRRDCWSIQLQKIPLVEWQVDHSHTVDHPHPVLFNLNFTLTEMELGGVNIRSAIPYPDAQIMVNTYGQLPADTGIFFEQGKPVDGHLPIQAWTELNVWVKYLPDNKTFNRRVLVKPGMTLKVICDTAYAGVNIECSALQTENELLDTLHRRYRGNRIYQSMAYFQELLQLVGEQKYFDTLRTNEKAELDLLTTYQTRIHPELFERFKAEITFFYGQKYYDLFRLSREWSHGEDEEFFHMQKAYDRLDLEKPMLRTIPAYYDFLEQKFEHYRSNLPGRQVGDWYLPAMLSPISAYYSSKDFYHNFPNHYLMTAQMERSISDFNLDITTLQWILEDYRSIVRFKPFLSRVERAYQSRKRLSPGGFLPNFRAVHYDGSRFSTRELNGTPHMITFLPAYQNDLPWNNLPHTQKPLEVSWIIITEHRIEEQKKKAWEREVDSLGIDCKWVFLDSLRDDFLSLFSISEQRMIWWPLLVDGHGQILAVSPFNSTSLNEAILTLEKEAEDQRQRWYRTWLGYGFVLLNLVVIFLFIKRLHKYNEEKLRHQHLLQDHQQNQRWLNKLPWLFLNEHIKTAVTQEQLNFLNKLRMHLQNKEIELHREIELLQAGLKVIAQQAPGFSMPGITQELEDSRTLVPAGLIIPFLLIMNSDPSTKENHLLIEECDIHQKNDKVHVSVNMGLRKHENLKNHPIFIENNNRLKALYGQRFYHALKKDVEHQRLFLEMVFVDQKVNNY